MGLFKALGKVLGGVAKAGLSVATRGVSDKVLAALKSRGAKRSTVAMKPAEMTEQQVALANKMGQAVPKVRVTEVIQEARAGGALAGNYKSKSAYKRKRRSTGASRMAAMTPPRTKRKGTTRRPPPGGLDLRAMAGEWRAAGKPGRWIDWIKANPIRRG